MISIQMVVEGFFSQTLRIASRFWFLQFDQTSLVIQVGPAEDEVGAAGGAGVVMDAGAMLAIATLIQKMRLKWWIGKPQMRAGTRS